MCSSPKEVDLLISVSVCIGTLPLVMCTNTNVSTAAAAAAAADQTGRLIGLRCPVMSADVGVGGKKSARATADFD